MSEQTLPRYNILNSYSNLTNIVTGRGQFHSPSAYHRVFRGNPCQDRPYRGTCIIYFTVTLNIILT